MCDLLRYPQAVYVFPHTYVQLRLYSSGQGFLFLFVIFSMSLDTFRFNYARIGAILVILSVVCFGGLASFKKLAHADDSVGNFRVLVQINNHGVLVGNKTPIQLKYSFKNADGVTFNAIPRQFTTDVNPLLPGTYSVVPETYDGYRVSMSATCSNVTITPGSVPDRCIVTFERILAECVAPQILDTPNNICVTPLVTCTDTQILDTVSNTCVPRPVICELPKVRDVKTNTCVTPVKTCVIPQILNTTTNTCEDPVVVCKDPQVLDAASNTCVTPVKKCTAPLILNVSSNTCVTPDVVCELPQVRDSNTNTCITPVKTCVTPQILDVTSNTCVTPETGPLCILPKILDTTTNTCITPKIVPTCVLPEILDVVSNTCTTPIIVTGGGGSNGGGGFSSTGRTSGGLSAGGGGSSNSFAGPGLVLGASTATEGEVLGESTCSALLSDYLKISKKNRSSEVRALQTFLSDELGKKIPVTGYFGKITESAVRAFQKKYQDEVLSPWKSQVSGPTGYVYKTTRWKINDLYCPTLNEPFPALEGVSKKKK
jgi:uncharacterized membrane protein YgcG